MHSYWFSHSSTQHWLEGSWKVEEFAFTSPRCSALCFTHSERTQCRCSPHVKPDWNNQYLARPGSKRGLSHHKPCPKQGSLFTLRSASSSTHFSHLEQIWRFLHPKHPNLLLHLDHTSWNYILSYCELISSKFADILFQTQTGYISATQLLSWQSPYGWILL